MLWALLLPGMPQGCRQGWEQGRCKDHALDARWCWRITPNTTNTHGICRSEAWEWIRGLFPRAVGAMDRFTPHHHHPRASSTPKSPQHPLAESSHPRHCAVVSLARQAVLCVPLITQLRAALIVCLQMCQDGPQRLGPATASLGL